MNQRLALICLRLHTCLRCREREGAWQQNDLLISNEASNRQATPTHPVHQAACQAFAPSSIRMFAVRVDHRDRLGAALTNESWRLRPTAESSAGPVVILTSTPLKKPSSSGGAKNSSSKSPAGSGDVECELRTLGGLGMRMGLGERPDESMRSVRPK